MTVVTARGVDGLARTRRRARLRQLAARRCGCSSGVLAGRPVPVGAHRRRVAAAQRPMARVGRAAPRDGRATSTGATAATQAPLRRSAAARSRACATSSRSRAAQVKTALVLAGLQADAASPRSSRPRRAATTPSGCSRRSVRRSRSTALSRARRARARRRRSTLDVPGDPSSAAFFVGRGAHHAGLRHRDRGRSSLNPTRLGFVDVLRRDGRRHRGRRRAGERVRRAGRRARACGQRARCTARRSPATRSRTCMDEIPVLAVAAAFADGVTEIRDAAELRVKESNRIGTVAPGARASSASAVETRADGSSIRGGDPRPGRLKSHGDHRIAMAAAVAANAIDGEIDRARAGRRSRRRIPEFAADLARSSTGASDERPRCASSPSTGRRARASRRVARGVAARARAARCSTPARCTGRSRSPCSSSGVAARRRTTLAPRIAARARRSRSMTAATMLDGRDVSDRDPRPRGDRRGVDGLRAPGGARRCSSRASATWVAEHGGGVVEGRDIGTVVFPDAPVKVFLTASDERARSAPAARRGRVGPVDVAVDDGAGRRSTRRDALDSGRAVSPLRPAERRGR